jgi:hypothetical protein
LKGIDDIERFHEKPPLLITRGNGWIYLKFLIKPLGVKILYLKIVVGGFIINLNENGQIKIVQKVIVASLKTVFIRFDTIHRMP